MELSCAGRRTLEPIADHHLTFAALLPVALVHASDRSGGGTGPWSYALEGDVPVDEVRNGVTWTYVGQYLFDDPDYSSPLDERNPLTGAELQWAAVRVDNLGREWRVADIDEAAMQASADDYAESVRREFGIDYEGWSVQDQLDSVREGATWTGELFTTSWDASNCDATGGNDMWVWDNESRVEFEITDSSSIAIQSTVVLLKNGSAVCSGAFVSSGGKVLTAAHCVTSPANGSALDPDDFMVCTRGNHYFDKFCFDVVDIVPDPSYPGSNWNLSFANDLAVMSVSLVGQSIVHLPLSTNSTAELEGSNKASNGYPEWTESSGGSCVENDPEGRADRQSFFRQSSGAVVDVTSGQVMTRLDTSVGASGGSITHTDNNIQVHAAVICGYSATPTAWSGGARTSANTSFINSNP